jgi:hypothetical protein
MRTDEKKSLLIRLAFACKQHRGLIRPLHACILQAFTVQPFIFAYSHRANPSMAIRNLLFPISVGAQLEGEGEYMSICCI